MQGTITIKDRRTKIKTRAIMKKLLIVAITLLAMGCYPITNDKPIEVKKTKIITSMHVKPLDEYVEVKTFTVWDGSSIIQFKNKSSQLMCLNGVEDNRIGCKAFSPKLTKYIITNYTKFSQFKKWNDSVSKIPVINNTNIKIIHENT